MRERRRANFFFFKKKKKKKKKKNFFFFFLRGCCRLGGVRVGAFLRRSSASAFNLRWCAANSSPRSGAGVSSTTSAGSRRREWGIRHRVWYLARFPGIRRRARGTGRRGSSTRERGCSTYEPYTAGGVTGRFAREYDVAADAGLDDRLLAREREDRAERRVQSGASSRTISSVLLAAARPAPSPRPSPGSGRRIRRARWPARPPRWPDGAGAPGTACGAGREPW